MIALRKFFPLARSLVIECSPEKPWMKTSRILRQSLKIKWTNINSLNINLQLCESDVDASEFHNKLL